MVLVNSTKAKVQVYDCARTNVFHKDLFGIPADNKSTREAGETVDS